ncbi:GWT1 domain-containing protein [Rozella allomycis CSF55]|uniref:GPI-anchored wall transfer protein 1 n=1 Tax=Rozella allomycis (strain CSF55) TaxID=988480 RepID=A0A075AYQ5_ROZAC|nr:GWT1 domain-containing protein [Rozella allomycis CSF55]|eukprot:EPZ33664.1 GWT1 domain-containing protein [Rozella allomycis CSF55]
MLTTKPFITAYRAMMMLLTCICILAVDFKIFPRRLAKTELYGTSLVDILYLIKQMDLGVGSVVFSGGVVSAKSIVQDKILGWRIIKRGATKSIPVLVLGLIRMLSVKGLDYQEHVSEYGVHWNFFFTLGFLQIFVAIVQAFVSPKYFVKFSIVLMGVLEVCLRRRGNVLLSDDRSDIFLMNKEGITSLFGYLCIYLTACKLGSVLNDTASGSFDYFLPSSYECSILGAVNRHQLLTFLLANVLTGLINMNMQTLLASDNVAIAVVSVYMIIVCWIAKKVDEKLK